MLAIDHLMMGVSDFAATRDRWREEHGLEAIEGIRFDDAPGWGNWTVPLGDTWVELIGLIDRDAARGDPRAQMFAAAVAERDRLMGWVLAPDDLERVARRLRLPVVDQHGTDVRSGRRHRWQQVGFDETRMEPYLPFFVGWEEDVHGDMRVVTSEIGNHQVAAGDVSLELTGDRDRLRAWLGDLAAPVDITPGPPSITARIATPGGELIVR